MSEDKFAFVTEWYDSSASLVRVYHLYYYLLDNSIEMVMPLIFIFLISYHNLFFNTFQFDVKTRKMFLKRCDYPSI